MTRIAAWAAIAYITLIPTSPAQSFGWDGRNAAGVEISLQFDGSFQFFNSAAFDFVVPPLGLQLKQAVDSFIEKVRVVHCNPHRDVELVTIIDGRYREFDVEKINGVMPRRLRADVKFGPVCWGAAPIDLSPTVSDYDGDSEVDVARPRLPSIEDIQINSNCSVWPYPNRGIWFVRNIEGCLNLRTGDGVLIASGLGCIFCRISGFFGGPDQIISLFSGRLHLTQLLPKNDKLRDANSNSDKSKNGNPYCRGGGLSCRPILGIFLLALGAAMLATTFYIFDSPREPRWLWRIGWVMGISGPLLIIQGTVLFLTGEWLLNFL
jgi:hypothetical protein